MGIFKALAGIVSLLNWAGRFLQERLHIKIGRQQERLKQHETDAEIARRMADAKRNAATDADRLHDDDGFRRD